MTTEANEDDYLDLMRLVEKWSEQSPEEYGPGVYLYWFLAQHVRPTDVRFADLKIDTDASTFDSRSGEVFLVTRTSVVFVDYQGAVDSATGNPQQDFGSASVTFYPLSENPVRSVAWEKRSLYVAENRGVGSNPRLRRMQPGTIKVLGNGWNVDLPFGRVAEPDNYFSDLRAALEL